VQLKVLAVADGMLRWQQRQGTSTNSEGQYRFAELQAGKYAVVTGFHSEGVQDSQSSAAYVPSRNPALAAGTAESAITLGAGEHREANLNPDMEKLYPVTGTIAGYGESRGVGFRVETASGEDITALSRFNSRTGEFRLMLPGGSYTVTATAFLPGRHNNQLEARREVTVPQAPVSGLSLAMQPYATIPIEVEVDTINPPAQGTAQPSLSNLGAGMGLASVDGEGPTSFVNAQRLRQSDGDEAGAGGSGPMAMENVAPGRYLLQGGQEFGWYVSSANCGGVDLLREELVVGGSAAGCSIRVVLRNDVGSAHITVRDAGQNASSTLVYLLPVGDSVRRMAMAMSGGSGDFPATGLAPGRYVVLALDHREELAYRDPESMRRYAAAGQEITVTPNGSTDVEVSLVKGEI
jgi:hypothetical protein